MEFLADDFLLETEFSRKLFHEYAENEAIYDYHCHLDPKAIYDNQNFSNLTEIWLGGDHYKWRLMRANGVDEALITGDALPYDKFLAFVKALSKMIGNPVYEWTHLELRRFFNIDLLLTEENAPVIWEKCNELLSQELFKPRALMKQMQVKLVCTTDDPIDDLFYHQQLAVDETDFDVLPTFRPDKIWTVNYPSQYLSYLDKLADVSKIQIKSYTDLVKALENRVDYFSIHGCRIADHGLNNFRFEVASNAEIEEIFKQLLAGQSISIKEANQWQTALQLDLMSIYLNHQWTLQIHINCLRNLNPNALKTIGIDSGFDAIGAQVDVPLQLSLLLIASSARKAIPKLIIYSLNANDTQALASIAGSFQNENQIQIGAAWWFQDTYSGMKHQLTTVSEQGLLGNFIGMLTDSRSFLSYPRHEYFRRILCNHIGGYVARGQLPNDLENLGQTVRDISNRNIISFLELS